MSPKTSTSTTTPATAPAPVIAGPAATRHPRDGRVMALSASRYPEVEDTVELWCASCRQLHPGKSFGLIGNRGSGQGRTVV